MNGKTLIVVPTYNEQENVAAMCRELLALGLDADVVFMDDNSPDGTGKILDDLAARHPRVRVVHRPGKMGIGSAHLDAIAYSYDNGYATLVTLDCDFTHSPKDIPRLLEAAAHCDMAVGSRYIQRGSLPGWNPVRRFLTNFGHFLTKRFLSIRYDATGAFRVYHLHRIPRGVFDLVTSRGYAFFFESMFILDRNGVSIEEIPIVLPARVYGHSKMSLRDAARSGFHVFELRAAEFVDHGQFRLDKPLEQIDPSLVDPQGWDAYWQRKRSSGRILYDIIAALYRRAVIRTRLNAAIRKAFAPGSSLLHAGCGTGQVDANIQDEMRITALDISTPALRLYRRNNPKAAAIAHGSILSLPFPECHFDGVYNLGVMEHFHPPQIQQILSEFRRVLKPGGRIVMFWPHSRGSSVQVLGVVHWFSNRVLRKGLELHPPEVTLMRSRRFARAVLEAAGLEFVGYSFGPKDGFVQAVVVGRKPGPDLSGRGS